MRRLAIAIAAALFAFPAVALTVSGVDMDGDNLIFFAEMMVLYPDLTEEAFADVDTSDDEFVDGDELASALESGLI